MRKSILTILMLLAYSIAKADFVSLNLLTLIDRAEIIAVGEIICVDEKVFELKTSNRLYCEESILTINKFQDWACAVRWSEYYVGQELMVFLVCDEKGISSIGAGNEGEFPIIKDKVYAILSSPLEGELKSIFPPEDYKKTDSEFYMGIELDLTFAWEYVTNIKQCFEFKLNKMHRVESGKWICSAEKARELKKKDISYQRIFERLITNASTVYN